MASNKQEQQAKLLTEKGLYFEHRLDAYIRSECYNKEDGTTGFGAECDSHAFSVYYTDCDSLPIKHWVDVIGEKRTLTIQATLIAYESNSVTYKFHIASHFDNV